jgi:hypothetical protein
MSRIGILSLLMIVGAVACPRAASSQLPSVDATAAAAPLAPTAAHALLLGPAWPLEPRIAEKGSDPFIDLPQVRNRRGVPFMIAGGAMFLAGAIIGDDGGTILLLGGIGVGAYGAYVYFSD